MTDNELLSDVVTYLNGCRNNAHCGTVAYEQFSNWISAIQQAASVVKCMDCKYHHYAPDQTPYCDRLAYEGLGWKDNDFCSYAERRWWDDI